MKIKRTTQLWNNFISAALLVFVMCVFCRSETENNSQEKTVRLAIEKINKIVTSEAGQNIERVRAQDARAEALSLRIIKEKDAAIIPLGNAAQNPKLPIKTRVFAVNFLGLLNDPGSFKPLEKIILDSSSPDVLRSQAASVLSDVPVSSPARRRVFCQALAQENLPAFTLSQVLFEVSRLGCRDAALLKRRAESFGARPQKKGKILALLAIKGLGKSFSFDSSDILWDLFDFFHAGSSERGEILKTLLKRSLRHAPAYMNAALRAETALRSESRYPKNAVLALRLVVRLEGLGAKAILARELKNPDPLVKEAAKKALAGIGASVTQGNADALGSL